MGLVSSLLPPSLPPLSLPPHASWRLLVLIRTSDQTTQLARPAALSNYPLLPFSLPPFLSLQSLTVPSIPSPSLPQNLLTHQRMQPTAQADRLLDV